MGKATRRDAKGGRMNELLARRRRHFTNTDGHLVMGTWYTRGCCGWWEDNITIPDIEQRSSTYRDRDRDLHDVIRSCSCAASEIAQFSFVSHTFLRFFSITTHRLDVDSPCISYYIINATCARSLTIHLSLFLLFFFFSLVLSK